MSLPKNMGMIDRALRIVAGLVLISLVFVGPQTPWGWIGVVPLLTAFIGFCPAYTLLGIRTCPLKHS
ncbi:YgaP family membrane protein [Skermanella pratensis]|uniref:YgaP family membrane protein n=1 Tax=Skermanella pratensis TaxID=2233999 RepID=UPI0013018B45